MSLIPIYFLTKKGEIKCKNISLEDLYRLYHWRKYPKNEEFVKKFIEANDIQDNLFYTNLEELKQKCTEKGKNFSDTSTKPEYQTSIKEIKIGTINEGEPTRYFYSIDMYGDIIKFTMSSAKNLTSAEMHKIVREYKLVYNATEKRDQAGKMGYEVITFGENTNLDDIMEKATNMVMSKANYIQDTDGQLKLIDFPQSNLNRTQQEIFDLAKNIYCLDSMWNYIRDFTNADLENFKRAYYILYGRELEPHELDDIKRGKANIDFFGEIKKNSDKLSKYGITYDRENNIIKSLNGHLNLDYINYKLEQLNKHLSEPRHYIDMYIPSKSSSVSQTSTRSSTVQPQPQQPLSPKPKQRQNSSGGSVVKSVTPSYYNSKTLCYDITKGEFSIKTYQEIEQDENLKKVMFPDTENISEDIVFKPKEINTFDKAREALHGTDKIRIEGFGQYVCNFKSANKYKLEGDNGYNILSIDINFINGTKKSETKMECTKKTYCYYIKNDGKLCYDALTDEEMKQNYVLKVRINEQREIINVPLDINSNTQKRLLLKSNTKKLHFSKSDVRGKACVVRFDNEINKLIFNKKQQNLYHQ